MDIQMLLDLDGTGTESIGNLHQIFYLSFDLSLYLSVYLSIYLYIYLSFQSCSANSPGNNHESSRGNSHIFAKCVPNPLKYYRKPTKMSLGGYWLNMDPFGVTFGTLRLRLDTFWNILGAFMVSLGFILETLGSILRCLWHLNATQSGPECQLDSLGRFFKRFVMKLSGILL